MLERGEVEGGQEAETAEGEGGDGGDDALEQPGGVEDCAVAAELERGVSAVGEEGVWWGRRVDKTGGGLGKREGIWGRDRGVQ